MGLLQFFDAAGNLFEKVRTGKTIWTLICLDRTEAMQALERVAGEWTPQEFDQFEVNFINASLGMFTREQRIRSMELYAFLKLLETKRFGEWRGFASNGGALA